MSAAARERPTMGLFELGGKVALVTGSSRGIGEAIATRMAEHGARVVISSRDQAACDTVAARINFERPGSAIAIAADVGRKVDLARLVTEARATFGRIDILVCNAGGIFHHGPTSTLGDDQLQQSWQINVVSNHWLIQLVVPEMIERRDGVILLLSSVAGSRGGPVGTAAYAVTKAADLQLARALAVEYGGANVRVNCLSPGLVRTDMTRHDLDDAAAFAKRNERRPLKRVGEVDEVAGPAVMLASAAGAFITGQSIVIDGGMLIA